jgi:hypothetical protein
VAFPNTPEGAFKAMVFAMATGDEPTLRAVTQPLAADDFAWLLKGEHIPADKADGFRRFLEEKMGVRLGRPGERFPLPNGQVIEIKAEEFDAENSVVVHEGAPTPVRVRKVDGRWKVNAAPIVAGRKAATAARKQAPEPGKSKDTPKSQP